MATSLVAVETERLVLRHWKDEDLPSFAAITADPKVIEAYLGRGAAKKLGGGGHG